MRSTDVEIPEPCHADWDQMRPEERGRYCFACRTKVHDLSAMTETEAKAFLERTACEEVCVTYEHDDQGRLQFRPPAPAPALVPLGRLRRPRTAAASLVGVGMAAALAACTPHGDPVAALGPSSEAPTFVAPAVVIPHGESSSPGERDVSTDEPCEGPKVETETPRPRVRGRMRPRPLQDRPVQRKTGKKPKR